MISEKVDIVHKIRCKYAKLKKIIVKKCSFRLNYFNKSKGFLTFAKWQLKKTPINIFFTGCALSKMKFEANELLCLRKYKFCYMKLNIIVLAKQVPDTRNVGEQAMNADGTINRSALPAIFNPEDLNALEQALIIKDTNPESRITVLTMGPYRAADVLREALYRGADEGVLLTDRAFAGADTLATSYAIATAIRKIGKYDIVLCGRQAIDGDTAQVGPQVAQQLGLPQITYTRRIVSLENDKITVERSIENGIEVVEAPMPLLLTVDGAAAPCRPRNVYRFLKYHRAAIPAEIASEAYRYKEQIEQDNSLQLKEWSLADVDGDASRCGLSGSPTKVRKVENVVFQAKENKRLTANDDELKGLVAELLANHTIG